MKIEHTNTYVLTLSHAEMYALYIGLRPDAIPSTYDDSEIELVRSLELQIQDEGGF